MGKLLTGIAVASSTALAAACSGSVTVAGASSTSSQAASSSASSAVTTSGSGGASSGSSGAGGASSGAGGAAPVPVCAVPLPSPSQGSCVAFTSDAGPSGVEADAGLDDAGDPSSTNCNPITNAGCTHTDICLPLDQLFACQPQGKPGNVPLCGDCADGRTCTSGKACIVGWTPGASVCVQMCCADADCGSAGVCKTTGILDQDLPSGVGLCVQ